MTQIPTTRREMFDCRSDIDSSGKAEKMALVARMWKRLTAIGAMLNHRTHWRMEQPQHA
jgi:hypothetical protein